MCCLLNNSLSSQVSWLFFRAGATSISKSIRKEQAARKTANWPRPGGYQRNFAPETIPRDLVHDDQRVVAAIDDHVAKPVSWLLGSLAPVFCLLRRSNSGVSLFMFAVADYPDQSIHLP